MIFLLISDLSVAEKDSCACRVTAPNHQSKSPEARLRIPTYDRWISTVGVAKLDGTQIVAVKEMRLRPHDDDQARFAIVRLIPDRWKH